jgi:hypothetical protein
VPLLIGSMRFVVAFVVATALFWAGLLFEHRPHGWPNLKVAFFHLSLPDGPWARLDAIAKAGRVAEAHTKAVTAQQAVVSHDAGVAEAKAQETIRYVTRDAKEKVQTYVPPAADAACTVPLGFVRLHDASARGVSPVPLAPGESYDAPSGLKLSAVVTTIIDNYGAAQANSEQLSALQAWVRAEAKVH